MIKRVWGGLFGHRYRVIDVDRIGYALTRTISSDGGTAI